MPATQVVDALGSRREPGGQPFPSLCSTVSAGHLSATELLTLKNPAKHRNKSKTHSGRVVPGRGSDPRPGGRDKCGRPPTAHRPGQRNHSLRPAGSLELLGRSRGGRVRGRSGSTRHFRGRGGPLDRPALSPHSGAPRPAI